MFILCYQPPETQIDVRRGLNQPLETQIGADCEDHPGGACFQRRVRGDLTRAHPLDENKKRSESFDSDLACAPAGIRTLDTLIKSQLL